VDVHHPEGMIGPPAPAAPRKSPRWGTRSPVEGEDRSPAIHPCSNDIRDWHIEVDMPGTVYEVRVEGDVSQRVEELFDGASVTTESVVRAPVPDQAALHGLLAWIDHLGLDLIDVRPSTRPPAVEPS
jgi:hypothetical protein